MKNALAKKLKQVPVDYLVVGVDPHENKLTAVAITQDFKTLAKFKFDNTIKWSWNYAGSNQRVIDQRQYRVILLFVLKRKVEPAISLQATLHRMVIGANEI